jgi:ADP-ribosylglycohydrolase
MYRDQVVASSFWAAWGDALGFMTELATPEIVKTRTGRGLVDGTIPWKRKIGGRSGVTIELPAGAYSDDTQLRLATSRAIRSDGRFDVEAFSKVELPVFLNYALGAGRGTKAAAAGLAKPRTSWCTNFFKADGQSYVSGGGNGAAMRIQPHVWASPSVSDWHSWLPDVVRNTITTHGHVRGIAGAVVHASLLADAMARQEIRPPETWRFVVEVLDGVERFVSSDEELSSLWMPSWEEQSGRSFRSAMQEVSDKFRHDLSLLGRRRFYLDDWRDVVEQLGGLDPASRGAGDTSALLAGALAWAAKDSPDTGLIAAANLLGSDTDTIATMAGAILGSVHDGLPPGPIQDAEFIGRESNRLARIASGQSTRHFRYPDLLSWSVPRASLDLVGMVDGQYALMGLGFLETHSDPVSNSGHPPMLWTWAQLPFKQTVLIRHRPSPREFKPDLLPSQPLEHRGAADPVGGQESLFDPTSLPNTPSDGPAAGSSESATREGTKEWNSSSFEELLFEQDLDRIVRFLGDQGMPPELLGSALITLIRSGLEKDAVSDFVDLIVSRLGHDLNG